MAENADGGPERPARDKMAAWHAAEQARHENGGPAIEVTVTIKRGELSRVTDSTLALYWHVAQANPAPASDKHAGEMVQEIGWEIIRRWLGGVSPEMYNHKPSSHYWSQLTRFAQWNGEEWVLRPEFAGSRDDTAGVDAGQWKAGDPL